MRHAKLNKRFGRNRSARKELLRSLARNILIHAKIKTTLHKAKEASKVADKLVTLGKENTLKARRAAFDLLQDRTLVGRLMKDVAPLFKDRKGGYTRIIHLNNRHGDGAQMAILEFVEDVQKQVRTKSKKTSKEKEKPQAQENQSEAVKSPKEEKKLKSKKAEAEKKIQKPKEKLAPKKQTKIKPVPKEKTPKDKDMPKTEPGKKGLFGKITGLFNKKEKE